MCSSDLRWVQKPGDLRAQVAVGLLQGLYRAADVIVDIAESVSDSPDQDEGEKDKQNSNDCLVHALIIVEIMKLGTCLYAYFELSS